MREQLTETLEIQPAGRLDSDELKSLLEPVKADFEVFDKKMASCLEGDSPLITSIARHLLKF